MTTKTTMTTKTKETPEEFAAWCRQMAERDRRKAEWHERRPNGHFAVFRAASYREQAEYWEALAAAAIAAGEGR